MRILSIFVMVGVVAVGAIKRLIPVSENTNWVSVTNFTTANYTPITNFITFASNRVHISFKEYPHINLYKFTDDEWHLITNYWREYVVTNSLPMSYGGPIDHAPK